MAKKPWRIRRGIYELLDDTPANRKSLKIAISNKITKDGNTNSIKGILLGDKKTPHRIGSLDKFLNEKVPYISFRNKDARKVTTAARLGSARDQLSMSSEPYSAKVRTHMVDEFTKGAKIKPISKLHGHHVRMLQMYRPFFEGLDDKAKAALADFAQKTKFPLGDAKANIAILDEDFHNQIHKFMIDKGYQVRKGLPKIEGIPDLGNTFESRKIALQHFFDNVQTPIERKLNTIRWSQKDKYNPLSEAEVEDQLKWLNDKETQLDLKKPKVDVTEVGKRLGGIGDTIKTAASNKAVTGGLKLGRYGLAIGSTAITSLLAGQAHAKAQDEPTMRNKALSFLRKTEAGLDLAGLGLASSVVAAPLAVPAEVASMGVGAVTDAAEYFTSEEWEKDKNINMSDEDRMKSLNSIKFIK
tara:strand:- start:42 stop:1280 length:1239 start_codon:yes stop_codon:yes gene_type:complete